MIPKLENQELRSEQARSWILLRGSPASARIAFRQLQKRPQDSVSISTFPMMSTHRSAPRQHIS